MKSLTGRFFLPLLLGAALALSACSLTASPTPPPATATASQSSAEDCLIGEWELNDFADTITSMLPSGIQFQYAGTGGRIHWTFTAGGIAEVNANNFSLAFADKNDPSMVVNVTTNGQALRTYQVAGPGQIAISNPDDSQLTYTATVDGVTVNVDQLFQGLVPIIPAQGTISYQCQGNSLSVTPPSPGAVPEGFSKIGP
jgi:hypothetical protein